MAKAVKHFPRRVLIASTNPLFGKGLQHLLQKRWGENSIVIGLTNTLEETLNALETFLPELVIVDFDDQSVNRKEFLAHFVTGVRPMQVMLLSLRGSGEVVVYDRRTLSPSQAENWLSEG